jgi:hypothetical protein
VQHAARIFGRELKFRSSATAQPPRVSVSDADTGSRPNARTTLTTTTTRHGHNVRGASAIPIIGATTASRIQNTATAIVHSNARVTLGDANA